MNIVSVLNKLDEKLTNFEGSVDRCINLAKKLQRVFLIERKILNFMQNKGNWV